MIEQNTKLVDLERLAQYKALSDKLYAKRSSVETEVEHIIVDGHEAIDLGIVLPNGNHLLWAACNVGATTPEESGLLFQFGRTDGYAYGSALGTSFEAKDGLIRTLSVPPTTSGVTYAAGETLSLEDDAANANMGGSWRMPTKDEISAIVALKSTWIKENGVYGRRFTGNGNSIFIPVAGYFFSGNGSFYQSGSNVWSSSVDSDADRAYYIFSNSGNCIIGKNSRYYGLSVRGVIELTDEELNNIKYPSKFYTKSETDAKIQTLAESLATADIKDDDVTEADVTAVLCPTEEGYSPWG